MTRAIITTTGAILILLAMTTSSPGHKFYSTNNNYINRVALEPAIKKRTRHRVGKMLYVLPKNSTRVSMMFSKEKIERKHISLMKTQAERIAQDNDFETRYRSFLVLSGALSDPLDIAKKARKVRKNPVYRSRALEMMHNWDEENHRNILPGYIKEEDKFLERFETAVPYRVTKKYVKVYDRKDRNHPDLMTVAKLPRGSVVEVIGQHDGFVKINQPYVGWIRVKHKRKKYPFIEPLSEAERKDGIVVYGVPAKRIKPIAPHMNRPWWQTKSKHLQNQMTEEDRMARIEERYFSKPDDYMEIGGGPRGWMRAKRFKDDFNPDETREEVIRRKILARQNKTWPPVYPPGQVPVVYLESATDITRRMTSITSTTNSTTIVPSPKKFIIMDTDSIHP
mmetsp:Transcript_18013/g.24976  ORF Transcript_18013/g.24976 Transcript_18013/m.24976 type:complete len:394 (-) Transcript_18013:132-1313(-)